MRLKPIAADRAATMATTIHSSCRGWTPVTAAARAAPLRAKGRAKMLWESLISRP